MICRYEQHGTPDERMGRKSIEFLHPAAVDGDLCVLHQAWPQLQLKKRRGR
jgi:hypothetical protein